jgi:hypothetical protein
MTAEVLASAMAPAVASASPVLPNGMRWRCVGYTLSKHIAACTNKLLSCMLRE